MFVDTAKIYVRAGDGGDGCRSFYKDKYARYRLPNGGPGGRGGNVIIKVDANIHTLLDFQHRRHFKATKGANGSSNNKNGRSGEDCLIKVPAGTIIKDFDSNLILRDLTEIGDEVIVARGGSGGRGNGSKKPTEKGSGGEEKTLILELKLLADCGIIGFPNAGKSTLISKISQARPKIAPYPFTTKEPVLGVVEYRPGHFLRLADVPGLIEGAHKGKGLGDKFLRHIERTKFLIHIVDIAGVDGRDPVEDYRLLNEELKQYGAHLERKTQLIAANKMDLDGARENLERFRHKVKKEIFPVSAMTGAGLKELMEAAGKRSDELNER